MLDPKFIRENPEVVKIALKNRNRGVETVDEFLSVDAKRRELQTRYDELRAQKNQASEKIHSGENKETVLSQMKDIDSESDKVGEALKQIQIDYDRILVSIPNIPSSDTPVGKDESENVVARSWGEPTRFDFKPFDHVDLGKKLDIIDVELSSKVSGSRFNYLKNETVLLEFALIQLGIKTLTDEKLLADIASKVNRYNTERSIVTKPFVPVVPPVMVKSEVYRRMGRLTEENKEDKYSFPEDDLYLIGSAEHTLIPMHMDEVIEEEKLPLRYVGFSTAFRREAGTYGKDTRGIIRVHQFDKLEMVSFTLPHDSDNEQMFFVAIQEYLMQSLGLPYQVMRICTGDMTAPDARQIDINTWMPGQNQYRETHTSDMNTDFQSRGLNTKFKRKDGTKEFAHTNDATVFAIGRMLIAIMENYQQKDGSIKVPEVLIPYVGKEVIR